MEETYARLGIHYDPSKMSTADHEPVQQGETDPLADDESELPPGEGEPDEDGPTDFDPPDFPSDQPGGGDAGDEPGEPGEPGDDPEGSDGSGSEEPPDVHDLTDAVTNTFYEYLPNVPVSGMDHTEWKTPASNDVLYIPQPNLDRLPYANMWSEAGEVAVALLRHGNQPRTIKDIRKYFQDNKRGDVGVSLGAKKQTVFNYDAATKRATVNKPGLRKHLFGKWEPVIQQMLVQGNRITKKKVDELAGNKSSWKAAAFRRDFTQRVHRGGGKTGFEKNQLPMRVVLDDVFNGEGFRINPYYLSDFYIMFNLNRPPEYTGEYPSRGRFYQSEMTTDTYYIASDIQDITRPVPLKELGTDVDTPVTMEQFMAEFSPVEIDFPRHSSSNADDKDEFERGLMFDNGKSRIEILGFDEDMNDAFYVNYLETVKATGVA